MVTAKKNNIQNYNVPLISTVYASRFFDFLKTKKISKEAIIAHCPSAKNLINKSDDYISLNQMIPVLETASWLLNDESAAFEFGQELDLGTHGLFGYSLLSSEDFQQMVESIVKHMQVCIPLFKMEVVRSGRDTIIQLNDTWDVGSARSLIVKMYMGSIYAVSKHICSSMRIDFDFPSIKTEADWASLAPNCHCSFNSDNNRIILSEVKQLDSRKKDTEKQLNISYSLAEKKHLNEPQAESSCDRISVLYKSQTLGRESFSNKFNGINFPEQISESSRLKTSSLANTGSQSLQKIVSDS